MPFTANRLYPYPNLSDPIDNGVGNLDFMKDLADAIDADMTANLGLSIIERNLTAVTVVNTLVETDLYRKTIAANLLGVNGGVRLRLSADLLNNTGSPVGYRIRVKFGATTVLDTTSSGISTTASSSRGAIHLDVMMLNAAANSQKATAVLFLGSGLSTAIGFATTANMPPLPGDGVATEDTTAAKDLAVTVAMTVASANADIRKHLALLEKVPHT